MQKLILTDLDHTLLKTDGTISLRTLEVLRKCREKGPLFAIATARYWIGAERYIELLKPDCEITTDGTLIHAADRCIYSCELTADVTNGIVEELLRIVPTAEITVANGKTVYWNSRHIAESEKLHKAVYFEYDRPLRCSGNKIVAELPDESIARDIADKFGCKLQCYRGENWYGFLPSGAGKTAAINALAEKCGISLAETVSFGDDKNDIDMLKMCGTGVAVANAVQEVLDIADEVTASNDEDGVALWLEKNVLA
ncbi:MAG: Cof-type HAD-IIB family hydrolase [Ruminococcus sp.]|uniref:HAD family hydrolase n=1 Tax=Ruminococcus sp. TaxID=41978 RepID=UPI0025FE5374|nr:HAD family hydrolase [Ruminococcus sp.]MCR4795606.1 Cof-type HAD-IIB family hydrolase [Ruminococcus sp.]